MSQVAHPGYRVHYNINPKIQAFNQSDDYDNPTGGNVYLQVTKRGDVHYPALVVNWQDGPRAQEPGELLEEPNGAFVEDVLWAALQRLEYFNQSKYRNRANSLAITHIESALQALKDRQLERSYRNVEGKHEV